MSPLSDKDLDRLSREAAEQFDVEGSASGWDQLEKKLDRELPVEEKKRRRRFWWFFFLTLGLGLATWGILSEMGNGKWEMGKGESERKLETRESKLETLEEKLETQNSKLKRENEPEQMAQSSVPWKSSSLPTTPNPQAAEQPKNLPQSRDGSPSTLTNQPINNNSETYSNNKSVNTSDERSDQPGSSKTPSRKITNVVEQSKTDNPTTQLQADNLSNTSQSPNPSTQSQSDRLSNQSQSDKLSNQSQPDILSTQPKTNKSTIQKTADNPSLTKTDNPSAPNKTDKSIANTNVDSSSTPSQDNEPSSPNKSLTSKLPKADSGRVEEKSDSASMFSSNAKAGINLSSKGFEFGILAGADVSTVKFNGMSTPGINLGVVAGYRFNQRWSVNTGLIFTEKKYTASGDDFNPPKGYWTYYVEMDKVDGVCSMWEIPLNIRYDISTRDRSRWFAAAGASTYLMKKENYEYYYYYNGEYTNRYRSYPSSEKYFLSIINISGGYERQISRKFSLQIEPYLKIPVKGVGFGNLNLNSFGTNFQLKFHPGK